MKPADRPVTTGYGVKGDWWATGEHGGVDYGCPTGDPVYAMWGGIVTGTSWGSAYGTHVVIDHDELPNGDPGLWAVYAHLSSKKVSNGARVEAGQLIGYSGATGNVSGPHLHVEVQRDSHWKQDNYTNPQPWIEASMGNAYDYDYSGKPGGTLHVGREYVNLDIEEWDPPRKGLEHVLVYLNCSQLVFDAGQPGRIRVRLGRGDGDYTGYQDYTVQPGITELLITHTYFEAGDGTRTWVDFKCLDGLASMVVGTRYAKRAVIVD